MSFVMAFSSMPAVPVFADEAQDLPAVEEEVGEDAPVSEVDESEVVPQGSENSEESSQLEKNVDEEINDSAEEVQIDNELNANDAEANEMGGVNGSDDSAAEGASESSSNEPSPDETAEPSSYTASAGEQEQAEASFEFKDEYSGIEVQVSTTNNDLKVKLQSAYLQVKDNAEAALFDNAEDYVRSLLGDNADFCLYSVELRNVDGTIDFQNVSETSITLSAYTNKADSKLYRLDDNLALCEMNGAIFQDGRIAVKTDALGLTILFRGINSEEIVEQVAEEPQDNAVDVSSYNATADLVAHFAIFGDTHMNLSTDPDGNTGSEYDRTTPNARAVAGDGEVVLTVPLAAYVGEGKDLTLSGLGTSANATAEIAGSDLVFHLRDASGTYEFSGASASFAGLDSAESLTLSVASLPDEVVKAAFGSQEPDPEPEGYNATADLVAHFAIFGDTHMNLSTDPDGNTGSEYDRTTPNARAVAGDGEVVLTVPLAAYVGEGKDLTLSGLGTSANATAEIAGSDLVFHLRDASGTYEFSGASASFAGLDSAESLTLSVASLPDEVVKAAFGSQEDIPSSSVDDVSAGAYEVTANLYALDNGKPVFLTTLPASNITEVPGEIREDGAVINGGRLLATYDGTYSLTVWLDDSNTWSSLGVCESGAEGSLSIGDKNGSQANFVLQDLSGIYKFTGASVTKDGKTYSDLVLSLDLANALDWSPSNIAPYSGNENLEPGTYTVTANLFVPGEYNPILIGYNAYMGSSDFPPTEPMTETGTLTVDEDGRVTLDLPILCKAFVLKSVDTTGDSGARVIDYTWNDETLSAFAYSTTGYISHFTFALDDLSTGVYVFDNCHEFPLPFGKDWYLPMYLRVDLANAHDVNDDTRDVYNIDITDSAGSITLRLTTTDRALAKEAESATLVANRVIDGADYESVKQQLGELISGGEAPFAIFDTSVKLADGTLLDLSKYDSALYVLSCAGDLFASKNTIQDRFFYFTYENGELERFTGNNDYSAKRVENALVDWDATTSEATFVLAYGATDKLTMQGSVSLSDEAITGVSVEGSVTDYTSVIYQYGTFNPTLIVNADESGDWAKSVRTALDANGAPHAAYDIRAFAPTIQSKDKGTEIPLWFWTNHTDTYSFSMPAASTDSTVYLVNVDGDGNVTMTPAADVECVSSVSVANGKATVTWTAASNYPSSARQLAVFSALYRGATGDPNGEGYAYYAIVSNAESEKYAAEPTGKANLTYTAAEQTGVEAGEGYTLTGKASAADAGEYTVTAALEDGYVWADGSKGDKTITWSIAPAALTATYDGEQVTEGAEPTYAVSVTGFVGDDSITTIKDYESPVIPDDTKPSKIAEGTYTLTPAGGNAGKNYQFKYVSGKLVVTKAPEGLAPGTYTITANVIVRGEDNLYIPGLTAYITNPATPLNGGGAPTKPVSDNATLVVESDGTHVLYVPMPNDVFTVRSARTTDASKFAVIGSTVDDDTYTDANGKISREGRITGLYFELKDFGGTYVMDKCAEFPTLLGQDWDVPLTLSVDFSSAQKVSDGTTVKVPSYVEPGQKTDPTPTPNPTPDPDKPGTAETPAANIDLVYNGKTQTGVDSGDGYTLTDATAKDAGTYTATATLKDGYVWSDGTTAPKTITYTIAKAKLTATYAGETVVEGATPAYAVNVTGFVNGETVLTAEGFKAPSVSAVASGKLVAGESFELTPAGGAAKNYSYIYVAGTLKVVEPADTGAIAPGTYQITANLYVPGELNTVLGKNAYLTNASTPITDGNAPLTPVSDNAKLVVRDDGSRVLVIPVVNPVFTLQSVSDGANVKVLGSVRGNDVTGSTQVKDRITELYVELGDDSGSYQLGACTEYPTLLEQQWNVPLRISADFSSLKKLSSTATITIPGQNKGDNGSNSGDNNQGGDNNGNQGNNGSADNNGTNGDQNNNGTNSDNSDGSYRLSAGTYTVTANIWLSDRSATGLPLMPYLTSGEFPPMNPVTGNATLTVDETGHATLYVPIVIQSKVMTVSGISGLDIIGVDYAGGYVSGVTVDLGTITDMSGVITRSCSATIVMGSLASTISGITGSHTWPATFQVVFTGVPVSGNAGSSYDWSKAATAAAGVGALAAEGTGASADMSFLAVATKAATQLAVHGAYGQAETSVAGNTAADFAAAGVSSSLSTLDPDEASGTDATAALALAASLSGGELSLSHTADAFDAKFLAA